MQLNKIDFIFVHHTAVSHSQNPDQWKQTDDYHRSRGFGISSLGFNVGYTYEIAADGTVRQARQEGEETCAVIGYNKDSVSICLDGNFDDELPTDAQKRSLAILMIRIMIRHNVSIRNILPHRDSYDLLGQTRQKSCYGSRLSDTWAQDLVRTFNDPHVAPPVGAAAEKEC